MLRPIALFGFGFVLTFASPVKSQDSCPSGTFELNRYETATEIFLTCHCSQGRWWVDRQCQDPEKVIAQAKTKAAIDLIVDGAMLQAVPDSQALRQWVVAQGWDKARVKRLLLSTLNATRGFFERAEIDIDRAISGAGPAISDDVLVRAYRSVLQVNRKRRQIENVAGPFAAETVTERDLEGLRVSSQRKIMQAVLLRGQGDYRGARALYLEIAEIAKFTGNQATEISARDAALWTRSLQARRDERSNPGARDAEYERHRNAAAALHAWELGGALADHTNDDDTALQYLGEAYAYFRHHNREIADVIVEEMEDVTHKLPDEQPLSFAGQSVTAVQSSSTQPVQSLADTLLDTRPYHFIDAKSESAYIVMDAMEFGKGDWDRAIDFVRLHLSADPENQALKDSLIRIEALSAAR